jgi:hypothetical protein
MGSVRAVDGSLARQSKTLLLKYVLWILRKSDVLDIQIVFDFVLLCNSYVKVLESDGQSPELQFLGDLL